MKSLLTKNSRSSSQSGWPLRNILYLKWQCSFYFLRRCFLSSITANNFTGFECIYEQHGGCLIRNRDCLPFARTCVHFWFFGGIRISHYKQICGILLCVVTFWVPCWDVRTISVYKRCSVRLYPRLYVGGLMSCLRYLCLLAYSCDLRILCCVFVLFYFVLCTLCRQFLWIVHFWLAIRYSLMFNIINL